MKKFIILSAVMCLGLSAKAQYQLPNYDFTEGWENCYPWEKGNKVSSSHGSQPKGWCTSNVPNSLAGNIGSAIENNTAIRLNNTSAVGNGIPGYLSIGTTWATAEAKITGATQNRDGGVFGGVEFSKHPDAIRLTYKGENNSLNDVSSIVAYTWKGTWYQSNVPSNTAIGGISYGSATKVTMTDRDYNILGITASTGGGINPSDDAKLIAKLMYSFKANSAKWTTLEIPFVYSSSDAPTKICVTVSMAGYMSSSEVITGDKYIDIDKVELVYYSGLKSATYNGTPIRVSPTLPGTINSTYDDSKLQIVSTGRAATIEKSYDAYSGLLTVTIKGENISEDPTNYSTFKFQFTPSMDVNNSGKVTISDVTKAVDDANSGNASATTAVISNIANAVLEK